MGRLVMGVIAVGGIVWFAISAIERQVQQDQAVQAEIDHAKAVIRRRGSVQ